MTIKPKCLSNYFITFYFINFSHSVQLIPRCGRFQIFKAFWCHTVCHTWWLTTSLEWFLLGARVSFSNGCLLQWERRFDLWEMSFSEHIVRSCSRLLNSTPMSVSPFFRHRPPGQPYINIKSAKCEILKVKLNLRVFTILPLVIQMLQLQEAKCHRKMFPSRPVNLPIVSRAAPLASISKPHKRLRNPHCSG